MAQEALQRALGDTAADRVGRHRVLRAFVERDVRHVGRGERFAPDVLQRLVRPHPAGARVGKQRSAREAIGGVDVSLDPVGELLAHGQALRLARLRAADLCARSLRLGGLVNEEPAIAEVRNGERACFAGAEAHVREGEEDAAIRVGDAREDRVLVGGGEDARLVLVHAHGRDPRRLLDLAAELEPAQEGTHRAEEIAARLGCELLVGEPEAPILELAVGHLADRDRVEEGEVATFGSHALELAYEAGRQGARSHLAAARAPPPEPARPDPETDWDG